MTGIDWPKRVGQLQAEHVATLRRQLVREQEMRAEIEQLRYDLARARAQRLAAEIVCERRTTERDAARAGTEVSSLLVELNTLRVQNEQLRARLAKLEG